MSGSLRARAAAVNRRTGNPSCRGAKPCYPPHMADPTSAIDRIDRALARIEHAVAARTNENNALAKRHAALRARIAEAVSALDDVIARGDAG